MQASTKQAKQHRRQASKKEVKIWLLFKIYYMPVLFEQSGTTLTLLGDICGIVYDAKDVMVGVRIKNNSNYIESKKIKLYITFAFLTIFSRKCVDWEGLLFLQTRTWTYSIL